MSDKHGVQEHSVDITDPRYGTWVRIRSEMCIRDRHHLILPREFWGPQDYAFPVIDCRPQRYERVVINSRVKLDHRLEGGKLIPTGKTVQQEAMNALLKSRGGILQLSCGSGKTVVALDFAARRQFPTLIIVDTTELMRQWREEIEACLLYTSIPLFFAIKSAKPASLQSSSRNASRTVSFKLDMKAQLLL